MPPAPLPAHQRLRVYRRLPGGPLEKDLVTNPLERLNKEIKRRTDVVGVSPTPAALLRLAGSVLVEAHDEWQVADKRYLSETSLALLDVSDQSAETIAPTAALTA